MSLAAIIFFLLGIGALASVAAGTRIVLAEQRMNRRLAEPVVAQGEEPTHKWRIPSFVVAGPNDRREIESKLRSAGFQSARAAEIFVLVRLVATILTLLAVGLASNWLGDGFFSQPLLMIIFPGLTYIGAKLALGVLAARRTRRIMSEFPFLLDLMYMMLQSGISLDQCLRNVASDKSSAVPILAREFTVLVADLDRGLSYELALERWAARLPIVGSRELAALFRQALFHGIELIPAVREFASEFSNRRLAAAKEAMGTITVRMVVLMIVFFMPALFIVLGGPPVAAVFDTLSQSAER